MFDQVLDIIRREMIDALNSRFGVANFHGRQEPEPLFTISFLVRGVNTRGMDYGLGALS